MRTLSGVTSRRQYYVTFRVLNAGDRKVTVAELESHRRGNPGDDYQFSAGASVKHPQDANNIPVGMKYALTRALQDHGKLTKKDRQEVWTHFFSVFPKARVRRTA